MYSYTDLVSIGVVKDVDYYFRMPSFREFLFQFYGVPRKGKLTPKIMDLIETWERYISCPDIPNVSGYNLLKNKVVKELGEEAHDHLLHHTRFYEGNRYLRKKGAYDVILKEYAWDTFEKDNIVLYVGFEDFY